MFDRRRIRHPDYNKAVAQCPEPSTLFGLYGRMQNGVGWWLLEMFKKVNSPDVLAAPLVVE